MAYSLQKYYVGYCPWSRVYLKHTTFFELDTLPLHDARGEKDPTQLGPLDRGGVDHGGFVYFKHNLGNGIVIPVLN
jgi:hypothetical protein